MGGKSSKKEAPAGNAGVPPPSTAAPPPPPPPHSVADERAWPVAMAAPLYALSAVVFASGVVGFARNKERDVNLGALQVAGGSVAAGTLLAAGVLVQLKSQTGAMLGVGLSTLLTVFNALRYSASRRPMPLVATVLASTATLWSSFLWYKINRAENMRHRA